MECSIRCKRSSWQETTPHEVYRSGTRHRTCGVLAVLWRISDAIFEENEWTQRKSMPFSSAYNARHVHASSHSPIATLRRIVELWGSFGSELLGISRMIYTPQVSVLTRTSDRWAVLHCWLWYCKWLAGAAESNMLYEPMVKLVSCFVRRLSHRSPMLWWTVRLNNVQSMDVQLFELGGLKCLQSSVWHHIDTSWCFESHNSPPSIVNLVLVLMLKIQVCSYDNIL